jgi:hypothetical protein
VVRMGGINSESIWNPVASHWIWSCCKLVKQVIPKAGQDPPYEAV